MNCKWKLTNYNENTKNRLDIFKAFYKSKNETRKKIKFLTRKNDKKKQFKVAHTTF